MAGGNRETRNYGLIKAIHVGVNPPLNTKIIWFDDNPGVKIHKSYNVTSAQWEPLGGGSITVNGLYAYIAYATDCEGADFSLTFDGNATHWALIVSATSIPVGNLIPSLFENRWTSFCSADSASGNFTYVRYADDCDGLNLSETPTYTEPCEECDWVDSDEYTETARKGNWTVVEVTDGLEITFQDITNGDFISFDLVKNGSAIPNFSSQFIQILQSAAWTDNDGNTDGLDINTDPNSIDNYLYEDNAFSSTGFVKIFNGSQITLSVPSTNNDRFSGTITLKVGNVECETNPTDCVKCRKYMAILTSDVEIENIIASLFDGLWLPIGGCDCGCSGDGAANSSIENLSVRINNLASAMSQGDNANKTLINNLSAEFETHKTSQASINDDLQLQITNNKTSADDAVAALQTLVDDQATTINDINSRLTTVEGTLDEAGIMAIIGSAVDQKIADFDTATLQPALTALNDRVTDNESAIADHETRITVLETP